MEFSGKTAIITGAASGMGLLSAQEFAKQGAKVVLTDYNGETVEAEAEKIRQSGGSAIGVKVDVRDYDQIRHAVDLAMEKFGRIDILVNTAGGNAARIFGYYGEWKDMDVKAIEWGLDVNLKGAVYFARAVIGQMIAQKSGVIINLGSIDGVIGGGIEYSAAKSGMIGFTKSLAIYGSPKGVRACCVSPGPVLTRPEMANMKTLLGRAAEPIEVVNFILYLCSDKAAFITGSNHLIDGGRACGGK